MHSTLKKTFPFLIFFFLVFSNNSSYALSCDTLYNRVFAECTHTSCEKIFFIEDIPGASGGCLRRPKIAEIPQWAKPIIEAEVHDSEAFQNKKTFELLILKKYWHGSEEPISFNAYLKFKKGASSSNPEDRFRATFKAPELTEIENKSFTQVKAQWEEKVRTEDRKERLVTMTNWPTFILSIIVLFVSVKWFRQAKFKTKPKKYLYISLFTQLILLLLAALILINWPDFLIAFHVLLVPIIWVYEIIFSLLMKRRERRKESSQETINQ